VHWGLPPLGYPLYPSYSEGGLVGGFHASTLVAPVQNYFAVGTQGQPVAPMPMADNKVLDSLLPGLPPTPTGLVVFRQLATIPVTAATGSVFPGQHHVASAGSTTVVSPPSALGSSMAASSVMSSVPVAAIVPPSVGQPASTTTTPSTN